MDRSIIPESHFEEAIRSVLREFGKFDANGQIRWEPIDQDWCWKGGARRKEGPEEFQVSQWRRKILDRMPLWS
jgi:hypothetical protein